MLDVTLFSALFGGLLTFFAPCTLPLIPGYIAFIGGGSKKQEGLRGRTMLSALFFVVGITLVFIVYGFASGALGKFLILHRALIAQVGGFIVIVLGLSLLDFFSFPQFSLGGSWHLPKWVSAGEPSGSFLLGLLFALGWSPCLGPILGTILLLAATGGTVFYGGLLLAIYSLGLALPFLLIAYFYGSAFDYIPKLGRYLPTVQKMGGVLIVLIGLLLVFGQFGILTTLISGIFGTRLFDAMAQYM